MHSFSLQHLIIAFCKFSSPSMNSTVIPFPALLLITWPVFMDLLRETWGSGYWLKKNQTDDVGAGKKMKAHWGCVCCFLEPQVPHLYVSADGCGDLGCSLALELFFPPFDAQQCSYLMAHLVQHFCKAGPWKSLTTTKALSVCIQPGLALWVSLSICMSCLCSKQLLPTFELLPAHNLHFGRVRKIFCREMW